MTEVQTRLRQTLQALVGIDSTSTRSNLPMADFLEPRLKAAGFACERFTFRDDLGLEKTNLLALRGTGVPELALVGHTDCVPFDPAWKEALTLTEKDGRLYGRGACDTKAFVACALVAAEQVRTHAKPLGLYFTADEEVGCLGAKKLVEARKGKARFAIVGEPTSLRPIRANKGYCLAEVEVVGKEGHSAYPASGASAIFGAARFLRALEERGTGELRVERDPSFEPPFTTVNVGVIQGGRAKNVIPGSCKFVVEWRPIPGQPVERGARLLEQLASELKASDPTLQVRVNVMRMDRGVDTAAASAVVRFIEAQSGKAPETVSFGTEAPQMTALGAEAVVFGPGNIQVAHQTGEFVPIDELYRCEEILERAILHFCG